MNESRLEHRSLFASVWGSRAPHFSRQAALAGLLTLLSAGCGSDSLSGESAEKQTASAANPGQDEHAADTSSSKGESTSAGAVALDAASGGSTGAPDGLDGVADGLAGAGAEPKARTVPCGLNGRGEQYQICVDGDWIDEGVCSDPDECVDGEVARKVACADGEGVGQRVCDEGAWRTTKCACTDESDEYDALADACLVPVACDRNARPFGGGDGVTSPYLICTRRHLENIATAMGARFLLARSMNLSHVDDFVPIGEPSEFPGRFASFSGEFDGGGRALVGLVIDRSSDALGAAEDYTGLFHSLAEATVRDLKLNDFKVRGGSYVGTLAGNVVYGAIERVAVGKGSVSGEGSHVGGMIGFVSYVGDIRHSKAACTVTGLSSVGGLVGRQNQGQIRRSSAHGAVTAMVQDAGGLVGHTKELWIHQSVATGPVSAPLHAGGFVGNENGDDSITQCVATGNVRGGDAVGGLVGTTQGWFATINASYSLGNVSGTGSRLGGLIGAAETREDNYESSDNYAFGAVTWSGSGAPPAAIGASIGYNDMESLHRIVARSQTPALPLVGEFGEEGNLFDSYSLSAAEFADPANFPSWNFGSIWLMSPELGRPILRWELEE